MNAEIISRLEESFSKSSYGKFGVPPVFDFGLKPTSSVLSGADLEGIRRIIREEITRKPSPSDD